MIRLDDPAIDRVPVAWLTTLRPDGSPHTSPMWFTVVDQRIWMASSTVNRKVSNLLADGRCSLALDGSGMDPVVVEGRIVVHDTPERFPEVLDRLAAKYDGWDAADPSQDGPRVLLELEVTRWLLGGPAL